MYRSKTAVLRKAIERYGNNAQCVVAMEEMAELIQALSKVMRGAGSLKSVAEEIADVEIMLCQVKMMFGIDDENINDIKSKKIKRLYERLENEKG